MKRLQVEKTKFHDLTFNNLQNHLNRFIQKAKQNYLNKVDKKLCDPSTSTKYYWSLLKTLLNDKKIPCIPPIFHNNKNFADFKKKSEIFNTFFAEQCSIIPNKSVLPSQLTLLTENSLANCHFSKKVILQIIKTPDSTKTHVHDMINIRMLKICGKSICKPLELILKTCQRNCRFPLEWKKANVVAIFRKGDKQTIKNYRPVSLLLTCGKIFERLLYDTITDFFSKNNLLSPNQFGFRPEDFWINQLLSINYETLSPFDMVL